MEVSNIVRTCKLSRFGECSMLFETTAKANAEFCLAHRNSTGRSRYAKLLSSTDVQVGSPGNPYTNLPGRVPDEVLVHERLFARREDRQTVHLVAAAEIVEGERAVYLSDLQVPFHDVELLGAVRRFIRDFQPDRGFLVGDIGDLYTISSFDKNPTRRFHLEEEVRATRQVVDSIIAEAPDAMWYWEDGNHEYRLIRELMKAGGEFYGLMDEDTDDPLISIPKVYGLRKRGLAYVAWPGRIDYAGFVITHGPPRRMPINLKHCAKWMLEYVKSSGVCGDFHRAQYYASVGDEGQTQGWYTLGCLCRLDPDYAPFPEWNQGFAYSTVIRGKVHPTLVTAFDRSFEAAGRVYTY